jgi:hypothetical protein
MVTLRYQLEVSSKIAPSQDVNFGWIRRFRVDGGLLGQNSISGSLPVRRLFDRNAEVEHRSLDECIGDSSPTEHDAGERGPFTIPS